MTDSSILKSQEPTKKEKFTLLYDSLNDLYNRFITGALRVAGFLLLVTGWLLTSETAQKTLSAHDLLKPLGIITLSISACLFVGISFRVKGHLTTVSSQLKKLSYMPHPFYKEKEIKASSMIVLTAAVVMLHVLAIAVLWIVAS